MSMSTVSLSAAPRFTLSSLFKSTVIGLGLVVAGNQLASAAETTVNQHPTIRAMSGAEPMDKINPKTTALLVIDFQNEYFTGRMPIPDGMAALKNAQRLIDFADKNHIQVVHVQHIAPDGAAVFALDGKTVGFHPLMKPRLQEKLVQKTTVSVFASTDLNAQLKKANIDTLIISGLMTHACIAGAARDAVPLGYNVVVASDATATRAIKRADGHTVSKDELQNSTLAEIEDTFGSVLTTSQIIALPID
ncbi:MULTISPECIES: cysteine hydrolase family protein [unclassified Pseudomonas]|uniref:cysteine hydrolase family protein n=1 Tax=unclassified Pseudomonas TaxID=196821 RepID=UPI002AC92B4A|nr:MULTISPECIES: isochorismatase family protein [unclassified Pseudomonas]MEB0047324.1 isochorismatase family protein [Pseudomonas sp. Dout3]MEB0096576.1 isochorismatase family protein [Pseudomonas sp. DC1.2]WPX60303.1 isochorismatase family protein [Pseudomonas sp. DC1.2]